jgi:ankyrin repeat protein
MKLQTKLQKDFLKTIKEGKHADVQKYLATYKQLAKSDTEALYFPLHFAVEHGKTKILELLLKVNPETNIVNQNGFTPLHIAACNGKNRIALILLEKRADINAAPNDLPFRTALFDATNNNHRMMVQILVQY